MYCATVGCSAYDVCVASCDTKGVTLCDAEVLDTLDAYDAVYVTKRRVLETNKYYNEVLD
jgi:hypothetical protein